jgi:hypothetical protein
MSNPDHIKESLETIFGVKILKFFDADPRSGIRDDKFGSGIQDGKNSGSATLHLNGGYQNEFPWQ